MLRTSKAQVGASNDRVLSDWSANSAPKVLQELENEVDVVSKKRQVASLRKMIQK